MLYLPLSKEREMISTVTTTVSTIVSSSATTGLVASLGVAGVFTLIAGLAIKELTAGEGLRRRLLRRNLDIIILPLLFVFTFIVAMRVWDILS